MKLLLVLCLMSVPLIVGCSETEDTQAVTKKVSAQKERPVSEAAVSVQPAPKSTVSGDADVVVTISPQTPVAGDCLVATAEGTLKEREYVWEVNGMIVQQGQSNRYCLENVRRDDVVSVDMLSEGGDVSAAVTVVNSPPRIIDSRIELITEGTETYIEITPEVQDADGDEVSLEFQWLVNDEVNEDYNGNRLPAEAYQKGDAVQVRITPEDVFDKGSVYLSREINVPGAAPVITSRPPQQFTAMEYTYQVEATDPDGGTLSFALEQAPDGMTIDAESGVIVWPLSEVVPGKYQVKIVATDPDGNSVDQEFTLNLGEPQ